jgi:hypothetical protein
MCAYLRATYSVDYAYIKFTIFPNVQVVHKYAHIYARIFVSDNPALKFAIHQDKYLNIKRFDQ